MRLRLSNAGWHGLWYSIAHVVFFIVQPSRLPENRVHALTSRQSARFFRRSSPARVGMPWRPDEDMPTPADGAISKFKPFSGGRGHGTLFLCFLQEDGHGQ